MRPRFLLLVALPVAAALLAGCSSGPSDPSASGPLGNGGAPGGQCEPAAVGQWDAMGIFDLHNTGRSPVTITAFSLPAAHGLKRTSAYLTPVGHDGGTEVLIGTARWPPVSDPVWAKRVPLIGAVIRPGQDLNLVFGLTRTGSRSGTSDGPKVSYKSADRDYTVSEKTTLQVAGNCS